MKNGNPPVPQESATSSARRGFLWSTFGVGIQAVLQIPVLGILARNISPEEFGIANAALLVVALGTNIFEGGVVLNIAQRDNLRPVDIRSAAQVSFLLALILYGLLFVLSHPIASFFGSPEVEGPVRIIGISFIFAGLVGVPDAQLYHNREYRPATIVAVVSYVLGYAGVAVVLALSGHGYWAIVIGQVAKSLLKFLMLVFMKKVRLSYLVDSRNFREHMKDTLAFSAGRLATYFANQGDLLAVGKVLGPAALGVYGRSTQLMMIPNKIFIKIAIRVITPLYASIQNDRPRVGKALCRSIKLASSALVPMSVFMVLFSEKIVFYWLGPDWIEVADLLMILAACGLFRVLYKVPLSVLHSQRMSGNSAFSQAVFAMVVVGLCFAVAGHGFQSVAVSITLVTFGNYLFLSAQVSRRLSLRPLDYLLAHLPGVATGGVIWLLTGILRATVGEIWNGLLAFLLVGGFVGVVTILPLRSLILKKRKVVGHE